MSKLFKAFLIDLLVIIVFMVISSGCFILFQGIIPNHINWNKLTPELVRQMISLSFMGNCLIPIYAYILFKDVLNISIGKRFYRLIIVDKKTSRETNNLKKILRNVTFFFGPTILLEIIMKQMYV